MGSFSMTHWLLVLVIVLVAGVGWWQRPALTAWMQSMLAPAQQSELDLADKALAANDLYGDSGTDALSLYVAALMLDSDDQRARRGLSETVQRLYRAASAPPRDAERIAAIVRRLSGVRGYSADVERFKALLTSAEVAQGDTSTATTDSDASSSATGTSVCGCSVDRSSNHAGALRACQYARQLLASIPSRAGA